MSDILKQLFESFLEAKEINYKLKDDVYTIHFEKPYDAIFGEKAKCTFNKDKEKDGEIKLIGHGSFMISKIISEYSDKPLLVGLKIKPKQKGIIAVQDKIDELQEKEKNGYIATYKVSEEKIQLRWLTVRLEVQAALQKEIQAMTLLYHDSLDPIVNKDELLDVNYEKLSQVKLDIKKEITCAQKILEKYLAHDLKKKQEYHAEFIKTETKLKDEHYQQLMREADMIVQRAVQKIEDTRSAALKARSFEKMYERGAEKKKEEKKLKEREKEVVGEKELLRKELLNEIDQIKHIKFKAKTEFLSIGILEVEMFIIAYSNGKTYKYIPELQVLEKH